MNDSARTSPGYILLPPMLGPLSGELAGRGEVFISLTVDGKAANAVTVNIQ